MWDASNRFSVIRNIYISIVQSGFFNLDGAEILLPKMEFEHCNYVDRARATFVSQVCDYFIVRPPKQFSNLATCTVKIALEREEKENLNRAKANSLTWSLGSF